MRVAHAKNEAKCIASSMVLAQKCKVSHMPSSLGVRKNKSKHSCRVEKSKHQQSVAVHEVADHRGLHGVATQAGMMDIHTQARQAG